MRIAVRDVTGQTQYAEVAATQIEDAQSLVLLHGVRVDGGEWLAPQAIVGIKPVPNPAQAIPTGSPLVTADERGF
jgi:hypothetical protein